MIAVYWTDLNPEHEMCLDPANDCTIYTYSPPSNPDLFIIQWEEMPFYQVGRNRCSADQRPRFSQSSQCSVAVVLGNPCSVLHFGLKFGQSSSGMYYIILTSFGLF